MTKRILVYVSEKMKIFDLIISTANEMITCSKDLVISILRKEKIYLYQTHLSWFSTGTHLYAFAKINSSVQF